MIPEAVGTIDEEHQFLNDVCNKYGIPLQLNLAIEECSELIQVLSKIIRYYDSNKDKWDNIRNFERNLVEEIADVEVMILQIKNMYHIDCDVESARSYKMFKLKQRMENDNL